MNLCIGPIIEVYHPHGLAVIFLTFELSVLFGALGFTYLWPYQGLVGCSPGVYGLIGGCWMMLFFHHDTLDLGILLALPIILCTQLFLDILLYCISYQANVGYASHFFGFFTGLCLVITSIGFLRVRTMKPSLLLSVLVGVALLTLIATFLLYNYVMVYPPTPFHNTAWIHNEASEENCCARMLSYLSSHPDSSKEEVQKEYYCRENVLYPYVFIGHGSGGSSSSSSTVY